jgi:hypothetical protein
MNAAVKHVNITKEYLDKIRGYYAIQPEEIFKYVPNAYRELPADLQAVFLLSPVSGEDVARASDLMYGDTTTVDGKFQIKTHRGEYVSAICRKGIKGWENYYNDKGEIIEYKNSIENIPYKLLEEIAEAISGRASLTEEELTGLK